MGAIHVHEFMSLDGVTDAPTWTFDYGFHPKMGEAIGAFTAKSRGILLGRTTYEMFEPAWSTRTVEDDPGAPFFNDTTKYVVSGTLTEATWRNSKIIGPYDPDTIRALKDEVDGDVYVSGSITLVRAMLADGLVDELHLFVYPLTRGSGPRLFPEEAAPRSCRSGHASRTRTASSTWPTGRWRNVERVNNHEERRRDGKNRRNRVHLHRRCRRGAERNGGLSARRLDRRLHSRAGGRRSSRSTRRWPRTRSCSAA